MADTEQTPPPTPEDLARHAREEHEFRKIREDIEKIVAAERITGHAYEAAWAGLLDLIHPSDYAAFGVCFEQIHAAMTETIRVHELQWYTRGCFNALQLADAAASASGHYARGYVDGIAVERVAAMRFRDARWHVAPEPEPLSDTGPRACQIRPS